MDNKSTKTLVRRISLIWAISLPVCFILCWSIGYFYGSNAFDGSEIGTVVGFTLGGAIGGLGTALELRSKYSEINTKSVILMGIGWAMAMFTIAQIIMELGKTID